MSRRPDEDCRLRSRGQGRREPDPATRGCRHTTLGVEVGEQPDIGDYDAAIDFTSPSAVHANMRRALEAGLPCLVGTSGLTDEALADLDAAARASDVPCLVVANFAIGAVLMMRFAELAAPYFDGVEIVELHHETKVDAPSGTAKATADRLGADVPVHSVRLPGLIAHQEVIFRHGWPDAPQSVTTPVRGKPSPLVYCWRSKGLSGWSPASATVSTPSSTPRARRRRRPQPRIRTCLVRF